MKGRIATSCNPTRSGARLETSAAAFPLAFFFAQEMRCKNQRAYMHICLHASATRRNGKSESNGAGMPLITPPAPKSDQSIRLDVLGRVVVGADLL